MTYWFGFICILFLIGQTAGGIISHCFATKNIEKKVRNEISRQLGDDVAYFDKGRHEKIRKNISSRVTKEINQQLFANLRTYARDAVYDTKKTGKKKSVFFVYKVPSWPRHAHLFLKKDVVGIDGNLQFATQAYGSSGGTKDVTHLIFQEEAFRVKDILLASRLIDKGIAEPTTSKYKFLEILKDQLLTFDGSIDMQEIAFSYVRHFLRGDISLGIQVPVVRRHNKISLRSCLTPGLNEQLENDSPTFFTLYPNGLIDFFKDILCKKNISFDENGAEAGIGDVALFLNYEIPSHRCERCLVGIKTSFPTSRRRDIYKLWDPELGNGGFTELALFGALLFGHYKWCNPHCFFQVTYVCPSTVFRRVPRLVSKSDIENISNAKVKFGDDFMLYGNGVKYVSSEPEFSELDSTVRRFADNARKTKIHRGGNVFLRVGNMIERVFSERLFFDFWYDLYAKWRDYTGFRREGEEYNPSILANNTYEVSHRIGANISWQPDDVWRMQAGGLYSFAGRNTIRLFEINGALSLQF